MKQRWWIDSEWVVPYGTPHDAVEHGWVIENHQTPTMWVRWGDPEHATREIPVPMKATTLEACMERFVRVTVKEWDRNTPWDFTHDRFRNIYSEEIIPCAIFS